MTTGEKIKQARTAAGLTQKDLAARLEIVPNTISQYENGTNRNPPEDLGGYWLPVIGSDR